MRLERLIFVIGLLLLAIGWFGFRPDSSVWERGQAILDRARSAPNVTVMRLDLEEYREWLYEQDNNDVYVPPVDRLIATCKSIEEGGKGSILFPATYLAALREARWLSDARNAVSVKARHSLAFSLCAVFGVIATAFSSLALLCDWVIPTPSKTMVTVNCPHKQCQCAAMATSTGAPAAEEASAAVGA